MNEDDLLIYERRTFTNVNAEPINPMIDRQCDNAIHDTSSIRETSSALLVISGGHDAPNAKNISYSKDPEFQTSKLSLFHATLTLPFTSPPAFLRHRRPLPPQHPQVAKILPPANCKDRGLHSLERTLWPCLSGSSTPVYPSPSYLKWALRISRA